MQETTPPILMEDLGILFPNETSKRASRYGMYQCKCGNTFKAMMSNVKKGTTTSCGCHLKQYLTEAKTTHGLRNHQVYKTWNYMIQRCCNPKNISYPNYRGKGITVTPSWLKFENFKNDMFDTWEERLSIDRIDHTRGYNKDNCRWANRSVQARNTRRIMSTNTSGYRGVSWYRANNKWMARICIDYIDKHLGYFNTALEAAIAYDTYVIDNNLEHTINGVLP